MREIIIGFDVREMNEPYLGDWSFERQMTYLLKKRIKKPLSIDPAVWSNVLDTSSDNNANNLGLWRNGNVLLQFFQATSMNTQNGYCVAFTLLVDDQTPLEQFDLSDINPTEISHDWELLGYDVADGGLISGLSNCEYTPTDAQQFMGLFVRHLNKYHLFSDFGVASVFSEMNDLRVVEHAPFYVYGIYRID